MAFFFVIPTLCLFLVMAFMLSNALGDWLHNKISKRLNKSCEELWRKGQADYNRKRRFKPTWWPLK